MKIESPEFGYVILKNRFYIFDLYSNTFFYVHCDLYNNYPEDVSPDQEHFDMPGLEREEHRNVKLLLLEADMQDSFFEITIILLKARYWFKKEGIQYFMDHIKNCFKSSEVSDNP